MSFSWSDVFHNPIIQQVAPFAVGLINPAAGALVAAALGTASTPDAVQTALTTDPQASEKILAYQAQLQTIAANQAVADHQADVQQIQSVNQTMQVEDANQVHWRNVFGYEFGLAFTALILAIIGVAIWGTPAMLAVLLSVIGAVTTLFGYAAAILGVTAWHDGATKRLAAGDTSLSASIGRLFNKNSQS